MSDTVTTSSAAPSLVAPPPAAPSPTAPTSSRPVLVLYAPGDEPFVRGFLLPALGAGASGAPVVDARDLAEVAIDELDDKLRSSGVVLVVISPELLTNPWSRLSELLASSAAVDSSLSVVPLVLIDCTLPPHIKDKVRLDFRSHDSWEAETQRLRAYLARPAPVEPVLACPYPGMRPFEASEADHFCGRSDEIKAMVAQLAAGDREILLIGPSGSGKSSLINAGVLPALAAQHGDGELVVKTMRPGDAPVRRLADCLGAASADAAAVAAWTASHAKAQLVVFVDQLEELFTLASPAERAGFDAALDALRSEPRCLLLLALRADFYAELMQSPLWRDHQRHVDLPPLHGKALRESIEQPARVLGVYFEAGLIDRLLSDAAGEPGVLPLLQETLVQLWSHRRHELVTLAAYDALGEGGCSGLAVAISSRADRCLAEMTPAQATIARRLLLRLVSFGEGRPNTRRRQTRTQLFAGEPAVALDEVLRLLTAARLVTVDGDPRSADEQVDLCHEVLITAWPPFATWVETRRADELRRRQIQATADQWNARNRGPSGLLDDGELATAIAWRHTDAAKELGESAEVTQLIDASRAALSRARRRRRRWIIAGCTGVLAFAGAMLVLALIASDQADLANSERKTADRERQTADRERHTADQQRTQALHRLGEQYGEVGRQAVVDGHFSRALPYLVAARQLGVDDPAVKLLFRFATPTTVAFSVHHGREVVAVSLSADDTKLATASRDGTARVWDARTGEPLTPPLVHPRPLISATLRADGARLLTTCEDNTARIWDLTAPAAPPIAMHHAGAINAVSFSADGAIVVTASDDHTAQLWNAATGAAIGRPLVHEDRVINAVISHDGTRVATITGSITRSAGIWDARKGVPLMPLAWISYRDGPSPNPRAQQDLIMSIELSADGTRVVTASQDSTAQLWDLATGKALGPALKHDRPVRFATISPDGKQIATVSDFEHIRLWDAERGVETTSSPAAKVSELQYSADGKRLLAQGYSKTAQVIDSATGAQVAAIELEPGAFTGAISRDGRRVITGSGDGVARVWDLRQVVPRIIDTDKHRFDAAFSPDGKRIAISGGFQVWMWTLAGVLESEQGRLQGGSPRLAFDRDGGRLAAFGIAGLAGVGAAVPLALHELRVPGERPDQGWMEDTMYGHEPARGGFSPDGQRVATPVGDHSARIWDSDSGRPISPLLDHRGPVLTIRFSPDGQRVVTASKDGSAQIWDAMTGAPIQPALVHPDGCEVTSAVWSPDGKRIATVGSDFKVRLWDAGAARLEATLVGHVGKVIGALFSPDGTRLVTHSLDGAARLWSVATGKLAAPPLEHPDYVLSAAFSPDGGMLVTTTDDQAQLWDPETGRALSPPLVHADYVRSAVFSPDGNSLLTVGGAGVAVWDIGIDRRSLDDWRRVVRNGSFPQLEDLLEQLTGGVAADR